MEYNALTRSGYFSILSDHSWIQSGFRRRLAFRGDPVEAPCLGPAAFSDLTGLGLVIVLLC